MTLSIVDATEGAPLEAVRVLMHEYGAMPHIAGRWDTVDADIAALPVGYVAPVGALLLAVLDERPVGCVALRALDAPGTCEMKRMYVRPAARGQQVGEALVHAVRERARHLGYRVMRLDTAPELTPAIALYTRLGFVAIAPYAPYAPARLPTLYFECSL
ncbi:MAG: GNAT family N-acetyltransferase [Gemmatimonadaceae bacterium]|nr:GNAT family N-acetyltransferase [Gemmatimonadaceae bacterium]